MRWAGTLDGVVAAAIGFGCGAHVDEAAPARSASTESRAPSPHPGSAPEQSPLTALAPQLLESELIVGSARGLEVWSAEGKLQRLISQGPALRPRWLDSSSVLVVSPAEGDNLAAGGELQRIALTDGQRTPWATLPPFHCAPRPSMDEWLSNLALYLQDDGDFAIDAARSLVCLRLQDRNSNMASVVLDVRVDLRTHAVERWLAVGEDDCSPPPGVHHGAAPSACQGPPAGGASMAARQQAKAAFDLTQEGEMRRLTPRGSEVVLHIPGYAPEAVSPSGRWLALYGDIEEHDYIYRRLVLLDRSDGRVYPVVHPVGPWPAALEPRGESPRALATPIRDAAQVVGESDVRWLGTSEPSELLVVDGSVIKPGTGTWSLDGQIAR